MDNEIEIIIDGRSISASELNGLLPDGYRLVESAAWVPREELDRANAGREVDLALTRAGARNLTAARALMPETAQSSDPNAVAAAVEQLKKENGWLFRSETSRASGHAFSPKAAVDLASMSDKEYYEYKKQQKTR